MQLSSSSSHRNARTACLKLTHSVVEDDGPPASTLSTVASAVHIECWGRAVLNVFKVSGFRLFLDIDAASCFIVVLRMCLRL